MSFEVDEVFVLCTLKDYFKDAYHQHLLIENYENELFVPSPEKKLWFVLYPRRENVFIITEDFHRDTIALYGCLKSVEYTYDEDDLVIRDIGCIFPLTVIIRNYFIKPNNWKNVSFYLWDGKGNFTLLILPQDKKGQTTLSKKINVKKNLSNI